MKLTCWHYYAEVPRGHTVIVRGLCPALLLGGPPARSPGAGAQSGGRTLAHAPAGELIGAPRARVGRRKVEGRPCGVQERIAGTRGRAGRQVPPYTKVEGKLRREGGGSWLSVRWAGLGWAGLGWASGCRSPPWQVLAPAGVRRHVVTPLWISFLPPAPGSGSSGGRSTPPALPAPRLGGRWGSGAAEPAARGARLGPHGPGVAPGSGLGGGAVSRAQPPHPGSPEKGEVSLRDSTGAPRTGREESGAGPGGGGRVAPSQAQLPGAGADEVFARNPGTPSPGSRPLEK